MEYGCFLFLREYSFSQSEEDLNRNAGDLRDGLGIQACSRALQWVYYLTFRRVAADRLNRVMCATIDAERLCCSEAEPGVDMRMRMMFASQIHQDHDATARAVLNPLKSKFHRINLDLS
jgi:hypothetical protein